MINLKDLNLSDLLPDSIKNDKTISVMAAALDKELQEITACIDEIVLLPRIDELPEDIVDSLAWQLHVDFYEPLGLDLNKKRALVKNSLSWHKRKGTKSALEEIIRILFLNDFKIEEWFEYAGNPYFFRLIINEPVESQQKYYDLLKAVNELKNVRSWLEAIKYREEANATIFTGIALKHIRRFTATAGATLSDTVNAGLHTGIGIKQVRKTTAATKTTLSETANFGLCYGQVAKHIRRSIIHCRTADVKAGGIYEF